MGTFFTEKLANLSGRLSALHLSIPHSSAHPLFYPSNFFLRGLGVLELAVYVALIVRQPWFRTNIHWNIIQCGWNRHIFWFVTVFYIDPRPWSGCSAQNQNRPFWTLLKCQRIHSHPWMMILFSHLSFLDKWCEEVGVEWYSSPSTQGENLTFLPFLNPGARLDVWWIPAVLFSHSSSAATTPGSLEPRLCSAGLARAFFRDSF